MFSHIQLKQKLLIAFLSVGIIPFSIIGVISLQQASDALEVQSFNQLEAVRGIKRDQISRFFQDRQGDMNVLAETVATLRQEAFNKLTAVRDGKKAAIESYFNTVKSQVSTLSANHSVVDTMKQLKETFSAFEEDTMLGGDIQLEQEALMQFYESQFKPEYLRQNGKKQIDTAALIRLDDGSTVMQYNYLVKNPNPLGEKHKMDNAKDYSAYSQLHQKIHPTFRKYIEEFGYYDLFLVDAETGKIVYSVYKESDFATSLKDGPHADSGIGRVFRAAQDLEKSDEVVFDDFSQYLPSYDAPAGFIASPIVEKGKTIGVLIFQLPIDRITSIMSERAGLGKTGETYLVGPDHLMRSDSYRDLQNHSVVASFREPESGKIETRAVTAALRGGTAAEVITDYMGKPVLSAYAPLNVLGGHWAILSEIDVAEVFVPKVEGEEKEFYAKYIDEYGYYNIFLINPDGYVFYTATQEADYQTNMVNGTYSDTNLGRLVQRTLETKHYGIADYAPYAPSKGEPAAFIANPIQHHGVVEMVVALQLSLEGINAIMSQREGMGESGETYLIGEDLLMRSDSYLEPEHHTVMTSFQNPEKGKVDTVAAHAALKGHDGTEVIVNHLGNSVLSAYTTIAVGDFKWALLAEVDESEAFAAVNSLQTLMIVIGVAGLIAIIVVGWMIVRSISMPILHVTELLAALGETGDFSLRCKKIETGDEIEVMADQLNTMLALLQGSISAANDVVAAVARGEFDQRMEGNFKGDLANLQQGVNGSADSVEGTMNALALVMDGLGNGDLGVRMSDEVEEKFRDQVNGAMVSIDEVLQEVGQIIQRLSEGDFSARMTYDAKGDLKALSDNINHAMEDLQSAVNEVVVTANAMGEGDLTRVIEGNYQGSLGVLKDSINATQSSIAQIVQQVRTTAQHVNEGASEISRGSHDLSSRTSEQAASLEETAASMEQISSTVTMNSESALHAQQLASESMQRASKGAEVVTDAVQAMDGINQSSDKISEIISIIDGIAFQTNLLALNAAVEAARAGDHGRGFAVVAGEVRTLAQRSAEAASEITALIEESTVRIKRGSELVSHSGDALESIQEGIKKLNDISGEIASATREQTQGIGQVNHAVAQLDSVTQENAALVEESAAASTELTDQAQELGRMVAVFKV
ncbi:MAG: HAMP domain-containing protein [Gammaproteobacteria bacterium]|jgi:methyl-accepting chemotaxis protein|nr:HAMP domain-containing protein [Gammaproteobacteria bacterium]MBT3490307.1 HAMP domain-containing protein [Gammaproteobacteria bacterium]MBT3719888.1 HAMP domain-containing protein [Gammaproteobacteria bacterium]MBT3844959.1 HAMP domain-containing protein [Gammaproteobacteria bacterium]MBT3893960.1 HAMP domain-containing protein [Gammaproteobacteria bacterium]